MDTKVVKSLGDLVMKHRGKRICIMGGGPTLAADLERVKADVWISVNAHGVELHAPDYVVAMDNTHGSHKVPMSGFLRNKTQAPIIGPWHWCDYQLSHWPTAPKFPLSGVVATWVAYLMGAHPVILAGFDCYGGAGRYLDQHKSYIEHVKAEVRVVSGPLTGMYQQYEAKERRKAYASPDVLRETKLEDEVRVRVDRKIEVRGHEWPIGTILTIPRHEVWRQIKHKSLSVVEA